MRLALSATFKILFPAPTTKSLCSFTASFSSIPLVPSLVLVCFLFDVASPYMPFPSVPIFYCIKKPVGGASFNPLLMLFPGSSVVKTLQWRRHRRLGLISGSGRSPGWGNGNPLQYSCQENSMDRRAWLATVHGVAKSWTWLGISRVRTWTHACTHALPSV